jgi:flagellar hook-associated protein 1 FlgK
LQAQLYNTLQDISGLANVTVNMQSDGTATVLLGGQSPLVQGTTQNPVTLGYTNAASPTAQLTMPDGTDVTALATQGSIGAGLNFRNTTIPSILSDGTPPGSLNQLMQGISDRVNTLLTGGQISAGPPAVSGVPLFVYSQNSLTVSPNITGSQLAAISPGPPAVANGVAAELASMASPTNTADMINGASYTQFYGNITTSVGQQTSATTSDDSINTSLLNQAESLRAQVSGVSLNDQASQLLQFQESYQASAQMISTINTMTQSLLTVMQQIT